MSAAHNLECYLVGGAVRDALLGQAVVDRDWVVVGSTPEQMRALGFVPVGKDFPVFIDRESGEEYALARTERKVGKGYTGFEFFADASVTLEDDLARRDLTINAIAQAADGRIVDPFGGADDLKSGVLRHVSDAFSEDPVRLLRTARFRARFGFDVAPETLALMRDMVSSGEVDALVAERVWQELHKALMCERPDLFIQTLRECGALERIFPELDALFGVPQTATYHPEVDTGIHLLLVMQQVAMLSDDPLVRFAALMHDLGKAVTPQDVLPSHKGHEKAGVPIIKEFCRRLRVPKAYQSLALAVGEYHLHVHKLFDLKPSTIVRVFKETRCLNNPERAYQISMACLADARGRTGKELEEYPQSELFRVLQAAASSVDAGAIAAECGSADEIQQRVGRAQAAAVKKARTDYVAARA